MKISNSVIKKELKKIHSIFCIAIEKSFKRIFCMDFHFSMEAAEHSLLDFVRFWFCDDDPDCPTRTGLEPPELARPRLGLPPVE